MPFERVDLLAKSTHGLDAEPFYAWLRDRAPLYRDEKNELWAVSRYDDVVFVSKHTEIFCNRFGTVPALPLDVWPDQAMINLDGNEHTCQRALVSKGFSPHRIAELEPKILAVVDELIDRVQGRGECDVVSDLARPLPMRVIGEMLGYAPERMGEVLDWTDIYFEGGSGGASAITPEIIDAFAKFCEFHRGIVEERRARRGDDLISVWLDSEIDGRRLDEEKLLFEHNLVLVGGSESTRHAISVGTLELLRRPHDLELLRREPSLLPNAVEEMIRWSTPFVRMQRTLLRDHEMHGRAMKEGDKILVIYPAANRDPRVWERPDEFDVRRRFDKPALSFGWGKHYCLGASLARLEMRVFFGRLLERLSDLRLADEDRPVPKPSALVRGLERLPVRFSRAENQRKAG